MNQTCHQAWCTRLVCQTQSAIHNIPVRPTEVSGRAIVTDTSAMVPARVTTCSIEGVRTTPFLVVS
jgi:hypothetical protein